VPKWPSQVRPLTGPGLPKSLSGQRLVGIHCWASWNGHDYEFADKLRLTEKRFTPVLDLYSMDVEHAGNVELIANWGILNVPAFVIFRDGSRVATFWMQRESVADFQQRIHDWLASAAL